MTGAAVAFNVISRIANGVVHNISVQAKAIKRKYRLAVRDEFDDKNWLNWACRRTKEMRVRTIAASGSIFGENIKRNVPQNQAEQRPKTRGHMWTKKNEGMVL